MRKHFLYFLIAFVVQFSFSQKKEKTIIDNDGYLVGYATKKSFQHKNYENWFADYYGSYNTEKEVIKQLKAVSKGVKIKGYIATWCWESRRDVPRLYKVLEEIGFDFNNLELISVDRSRTLPVGKNKGDKIGIVPEFIFTKNGKELGRLTKYPMGNIEKYLLKTIIGEPFQKQKKVSIKRS